MFKREFFVALTDVINNNKNNSLLHNLFLCLVSQGRRSDIYYTASNWDSDGDSNEPLRKCPKFDDDSDCQLDELTVFSNTTATACCDEEFISSGDLCNFSQEDGNQEVLKLNQQQQQPEEHLVGNGFSLHTIPFTEEQYSHHQLSYRNGSIISNHGQLTEQVVPGPSSCSVSQQDQVLLLNQQQHKQRKGSRGEQRECQQNGSVVSVTLNEVDFERMGQSHDSENVFSQSVRISGINYALLPPRAFISILPVYCLPHSLHTSALFITNTY